MAGPSGTHQTWSQTFRAYFGKPQRRTRGTPGQGPTPGATSMTGPLSLGSHDAEPVAWPLGPEAERGALAEGVTISVHLGHIQKSKL